MQRNPRITFLLWLCQQKLFPVLLSISINKKRVAISNYSLVYNFKKNNNCIIEIRLNFTIILIFLFFFCKCISMLDKF